MESRAMIFVVMGRLQARRDSITKQLVALGLEFKEVPAVYLDEAPESARESKLKLAEIGCVLAHHVCYKYMVEHGISAALILEDDAILDERIAKLDLSALTACADIILLGLSKLAPEEYKMAEIFYPLIRPVAVSGVNIGKPYKIREKGCVGYVCSLNGADQLIKINNKKNFVADAWVKYSENLDIFESRPLLVYEDFFSLGSEIEFQRSGKVKFERNITARKIASRYIKGHFLRVWIFILLKFNIL